MDADWMAPLKEINGINLENYHPYRRSLNSVKFLHKRCLNKPLKYDKESKTMKEKRLKSEDKGLQASNEKVTDASKQTFHVTNNDHVLEHTIQFAKDLVPIVMPSNDEKVPVFYTIKSKQKSKKTNKKPHRTSFEHEEPINEKTESKKVVETYRKVKKGSFSISQSSNNTLDDLNINHSLCCTLSEMSEKKIQKKEKSHVKKRNNATKLLVSESFEALATDNITSDGKIKIHLMNERDKNILSDSIKIPVLNAIKDCVSELINNTKLNSEVSYVQQTVKCNTDKLDKILDRLANIEKTLNEKKNDEKAMRTKVHTSKSSTKTSTLEELGDDLIETKEGYSSEEELHHENLDRRCTSSVILFTEDGKRNEKGDGEVNHIRAPVSVGVKTEHLGRIPARFCWTDAGKNN